MNPTFPARLDAKAALARYLRRHPDEADALRTLRIRLLTDARILVRANMDGHITTSVLALDPSLRRALLVHHRALDAWLQPGGHYEPPGSLWESARRELVEETGVDARPFAAKAAIVPIDIDTHAIPSRPTKNETAHCHHDFAYLAIAERDGPLRVQADEVSEARWFDLDELVRSPNARTSRLATKALRAIAAASQR